MPPKSKTGFKWKSIIGFGLSGSKPTTGEPSDRRYRDGIGTGTSEQGPHASSTDIGLPSPAPRPSPDATAGQSAVVKHQPSDSGNVKPSPVTAPSSSPTLHTAASSLLPSDSPPPGPLPSPDLLIIQPIGGFEPLLGSSGIPFLRHYFRHLPPTGAFPSFFTNANNFQLQNLHYHHQAPIPSSNAPPRSDKGWKILLKNTAPSALYDSAARFDPPSVDDGTRVEVTERITTWIEDPESPTRLLCMTGAAGAGKSALQQTIAERYARSKALAASFFFSSSDPSRNSRSSVVPTIAYQLGQGHPHLKQWIGEAVDNDHLVFEKSLKTQMDVLIVGPVERLRLETDCATFSSLPYLITIDALDECLVEKHQTELLSVIHTSLLCNSRMPFRIFLASRPEVSVRTALQGHMKGSIYHLRLSDDFDAADDIRRTLWRRLREIGAQSGDPHAHPNLWPTEVAVESLVKAASGQFVYAATVIRYISERRGSPVKRLKMVLDWRNVKAPLTSAPFAELDLVYTSILSNAKQAWEVANPDSPYDFVVLLRVLDHFANARLDRLMVKCYPDSSSLCRLLGLDSTTLDTITLDLQSLVRVVGTSLYGERPQFYHLSFGEFLDTATRSKGFYCSRVLVTEFLICCLMRQIRDGTDPDTVEGATQSLPLAIYWLLQVEVRRLGGSYQISQELYDTFLRFTCGQGWERVFKAWMPGIIYPTIVTIIGEFTEQGIILLFAMILEHSIDEDSDEQVIDTIRNHYTRWCEQNAPILAREKQQDSNLRDSWDLPFHGDALSH
ncbi:hypothetical protein FA13DRAFT_1814481 [Coprinellus micaceus]|uniref:Guanylate kinase-like domain-containing protein n=1 Tax=Coprinellus micaceus TaxID=71717 RepID=A0A4Y7T911_COPMI|nr:hypothetical protein FA13DRAFT_1814481 [Coprinellus micaceus]